jgi:hypothetical protein
MLLLPLGKGSCSCVENVKVKVKVKAGPKYEWVSYHKSLSPEDICKEEIEKYRKFLEIKKSKKSKRIYYLTEEQRKQLKKLSKGGYIDILVSYLKREKALPHYISVNKIKKLVELAINGSPLTKKEKEKLEIILKNFPKILNEIYYLC